MTETKKLIKEFDQSMKEMDDEYVGYSEVDKYAIQTFKKRLGNVERGKK